LVVPGIIKTSDMVQEITSASKEQKVGMRQLSQAASQQEQVTQLVSANSEELASASEEMASQSESLVDLVNTFKLRSSFTIKKLEHKPSTKQTSFKTKQLQEKKVDSRISKNQKNLTEQTDVDDDTGFIQL